MNITSYAYRTLVVLLLSTQLLFAQMQIDFKYQENGKEFDAKVSVSYAASFDGRAPLFFTNTNNPILDFTGIKNGQLKVSFSNLEWDRKRHNTNIFVVKRVWIQPTVGLRKANSGDLTINKKNGQNSGEILFDVIGNGSGEIVIQFGVITDGDDVSAAQPSMKVSKTYTIKNFASGGASDRPTPTVDKDTEAWENAKKLNSVNSYDEYLRYYPTGKYTGQARSILADMRDNEAWKIAANSYTIDGYTTYINNYPNGKYVIEARKRIEDLRDTEDWNIAKNKNTPQSYKEYIGRHPAGKFVAQAQKLASGGSTPPKPPTANELSPDEKIWSEIKNKGGLEDLRTFITDYPDSKFVAEARIKINKLDENFWTEINKEGSMAEDACKMYLSNFPDGIHGEEAKKICGSKDNTPLKIESLKADILSEGNNLKINITGGLPPFLIEVYQEGESFPACEIALGAEREHILDKAKTCPKLNGKYLVILKDKAGLEVVEVPNIAFSASGTGMNKFIWVILGLLPVLGFVAWTLKKQQDRKIKRR